MPISITCPGCDKRLRAKDTLAGKRVACPGCGEMLLIPAAEDDAARFLLDDDPPAEQTPPPPSRSLPTDERPAPSPRFPLRSPSPLGSSPAAQAALSVPLRVEETPVWLRHLHWLLVLALLPLALSLLQQRDDRKDFGERLEETLHQLPPQAQERALSALDRLEKDEGGSLNDLFAALPEHRLIGALLPRGSWMHWAYAGGATALFMAFLLLLSAHKGGNPLGLLAIGLFTATAGIVLLFALQIAADWTQGVWLHGNAFLVAIFYVLKLIGFSYRAALDPDNGFLLSFFGFTVGVGFCEEVCKALPLLWHYRQPSEQRWRGAFLWGLASGAGFGISEGISYASNYYNGVSGADLYVVRFISCVALHALWTGSVAITLHQKQALIQADLAWYEYIPRLFLIVLVPMVLHGLYDTLLKKEMNAAALAVALASFAYLAFQTSRLHGGDDRVANEEMLREYQRRRRAIAERGA